MNRRAVLRLVDANVNRALEGNRVCEDLVRFGLEAPRLYRRLRGLRHAIADAARRLPVSSAELAGSRNSRADAGRKAPSARMRSTEHSLVANLQRVKEALRCLEESSRLLAPRHAARFQRLRFLTYDLERELLLHVASLRRH
jgi:thiamine-phosphate pyrophosphorylase